MTETLNYKALSCKCAYTLCALATCCSAGTLCQSLFLFLFFVFHSRILVVQLCVSSICTFFEQDKQELGDLEGFGREFQHIRLEE